MSQSKFREALEATKERLSNAEIFIQKQALYPSPGNAKEARLMSSIDKALKSHHSKIAAIAAITKRPKPPAKATMKEREQFESKALRDCIKSLENELKLIRKQMERFKERIKKDHKDLNVEIVTAINTAYSCYTEQLAGMAVASLQIKADSLLGQSHHKDKKADNAKLEALFSRIDDCLYRHFYQKPPITKAEYKKEMSATLKEINKILDKHTTTKAKVKAVGKGVLGVLAAVTVIPALLTDAFAKNRFKGTFFPSSPTKKLKHDLGKVVQFKDEKKAKKGPKKTNKVTPLAFGEVVKEPTKKQKKWVKGTEKELKKLQKEYDKKSEKELKKQGLFAKESKNKKADKKQQQQYKSNLNK